MDQEIHIAHRFNLATGKVGPRRCLANPENRLQNTSGFFMIYIKTRNSASRSTSQERRDKGRNLPVEYSIKMAKSINSIIDKAKGRIESELFVR